jgi:hypothetical protein
MDPALRQRFQQEQTGMIGLRDAILLGCVACVLANRAIAAEPPCEVSVTDGGLMLRRHDGTPLWPKPFANRWLSAGPRIQAAPNCQWVLAAGHSGYRHVWVLGADGRPRAHFASPGTPYAVAISHDSLSFVVGTSAGHVLFGDERGKVLRDVSDGLYVVSELTYSPDDAFVMTTSAIVALRLFRRDGATVWSRSTACGGVTPSGDWQRFLIQASPCHGVQLTGLELVARDGTSLWSATVLDAAVEIDGGGTRISISSQETTTPYGPDYDWAFQPPVVMDWDGKVLSGALHAEP